MLHYLTILAILLAISYGKPLSTCTSQMSCMDLFVTEQDELDSDGNKQFELCLFFNTKRAECKKEGGISHACPSDKEEDKIEEWRDGEENAMCNIVSCDGYTQFGIKDGASCDGGGFKEGEYGDFGLEGYNQYAQCYGGGYCGGGNTKACRWLILAPECHQEDTTTDKPTTDAPKEDDTTTTGSVYHQRPDPTTTGSVEQPPSCYCSDVPFEDPDAWQSCDQCDQDCIWIEDADSPCKARYPLNPTGDNVYVRDEITDGNSNLNFVINDDTETNTENANNANKLINGYFMVSLFVAIIVYLF